MSDVFLFAFGSEGFESIINLSLVDRERVRQKLTNEKHISPSPDSIISQMSFRARFNQQRKMEVWLMKAETSITESDFWDWADNDPQGLADAVRRRGYHCYGGSVTRSGKMKSPKIV